MELVVLCDSLGKDPAETRKSTEIHLAEKQVPSAVPSNKT